MKHIDLMSGIRAAIYAFKDGEWFPLKISEDNELIVMHKRLRTSFATFYITNVTPGNIATLCSLSNTKGGIAQYLVLYIDGGDLSSSRGCEANFIIDNTQITIPYLDWLVSWSYLNLNAGSGRVMCSESNETVYRYRFDVKLDIYFTSNFAIQLKNRSTTANFELLAGFVQYSLFV